MRRLIRTILVLVGALVVLLVIAGAIGFFAINSIAKRAIESGASSALGVPTTVDRAGVALLDGQLELNGLEIANPPGFTAPHFLTMDRGQVQVALRTLTADTVEVPRLYLSTVDARLERTSSGSNYGVILDHIRKNAPPEGEPPSTEQERRFIIHDLVIRDVTVHLDLLGAPSGLGAVANELARVTVPIDEIRLTDVGRTGEGVAGSGVTMQQLAAIVVEAVLAAAVEKSGGAIPPEVSAEITGALTRAGELQALGLQVVGEARGALEQLQRGDVPGAAERGRETVEEVRKSIEGLIPGRKPEPAKPAEPERKPEPKR